MSGATRSLISFMPVTTLTLLQFSNGKAVRFVAFFSALPALFAIIFTISSTDDTATDFMHDITLGIVLGTLLPIATLILATTAFRDEIEDRTMVYLILKPVSRFRLVAEKYLAVVLVTALSLWVGMILAWFIVGVIATSELLDTVEVLVAALVTILVGVMLYGAVFLAVSLVIPRALVVGIIYTLIWESLFSRLIPGVWVMSLRHYVDSVYYRLVDDATLNMSNALQLYSALPLITVVIVVALGLTTLRLRTMDFE